jgi:hemerythrin-like domain-containing protein
MDNNSQTARLLHAEHMEEIAALERLEGALHQRKVTEPPALGDEFMSRVLPDLIANTDAQINLHFVFEETHLFPKLDEYGEGGIGMFLASEHKVIRETGSKVLELARAARENGFDAESWREFYLVAGELIEWVVGHVQKEEMGLLPLVQDLLDEDADSELANAYMAAR